MEDIPIGFGGYQPSYASLGGLRAGHVTIAVQIYGVDCLRAGLEDCL